MWIGTAAGVVLSVAGWRAVAADAIPAGRAPLTAIPNIAEVDPGVLRQSAEEIVRRDLFRVRRRPASVPFDPDPAPRQQAPAPRPPRAPLPILRGTTGPPWQAVLEGVPGHDGGVVARVGNVLGTFTIVRIARDTVQLQAPDTMFTLTVRRESR